MSSNRPETTAPPNSDDPGSEHSSSDKQRPLVRTDSYIPNILDLITPIHRARDSIKIHVPPAFFQSEAVDSSLFLGHGASFTVTRQALPPGPEYLVERTNLPWGTIEKSVKAPERPKNIAYKAARVSFQENGEPKSPQDRRALLSVLTEFHALLHPPLQEHSNIITFLGLAWGTNHADPLHRLPVLVVEYGDLGTLADVQARGPAFSNSFRIDVCLGIARGLEALHKSGIVHGDVKPENILCFSHKETTLVPKLADFGFAVIESAEAPQVLIGGSRIWRAPESFSPIPVDMLKYTDIYSFGLVAWSIATDGKDPFSFLILGSNRDEDRLAEIDRLKANNDLLELSKFENWIVRYKLQEEINTITSQIGQAIRAAVIEIQSLLFRMLVVANWPLSSPTSSVTEFSQQRDSLNRMISQLCQGFRQQTFYKDLEFVLNHTLNKNPKERKLSTVLSVLNKASSENTTRDVANLSLTEETPTAGSVVVDADSNVATEAIFTEGNSGAIHQVHNTASETAHFRFSPIHSIPLPNRTLLSTESRSAPRDTISWYELGYKSHQYSWQITRDLDPSVQNFVFKTTLHASNAPNRFLLTSFWMNGYGVPSDMDQALGCIELSAKGGHPLAQAYLYRLFSACQREIPANIPVMEYLKRQALCGSRTALMDLLFLDPDQGKYSKELIKYGYGGVGANWFNEGQWLQGLSQPKLMRADFMLSSLGSREELPELVVNNRGDRVIHAAAAVGAYSLVKELLNDIDVDVNQLNAKGETPLLCASRSNHSGIVKLLLDSGARASIQATNGESPLHWLGEFDDGLNISALGTDLINRGRATVDAFTREQVSHSVFPGSIDVDFQPPGTPLLWAVHDNKPEVVRFLLSRGANPNWKFDKTALSPLEWASHFHHNECLEIIIDHLENTVALPMTTEGQKDVRHAVKYGVLVRYAIHASDRFSMVLRNGKGYLTQLKSTLKFLQEKTKLVNFTLDDQNETLLHFAAAEAHDEACKIILESGWRIEEINKPAGAAGRTPLLEAVRWNRRELFHLFRTHGADVQSLAFTPYEDTRSWSALHIFADQGHNDHLALVDDLIDAGISVDGDMPKDIETPFNIAVRRNAFKLANLLLDRGASINTRSTKSSLITSSYPLTGLGFIIASNSRYCFHSLRYLLDGCHEKSPEAVSFVVDPERGFTALHLCAIVPYSLTLFSGEALSTADFDWETNGSISHEILERFQEQRHLDWPCITQGNTALHLAAEHGNVGVIRELTKKGADKKIMNVMAETAADVVKRIFGGSDSSDKLKSLLDLLT